jgi:hypothetical protein
MEPVPAIEIKQSTEKIDPTEKLNNYIKSKGQLGGFAQMTDDISKDLRNIVANNSEIKGMVEGIIKPAQDILLKDVNNSIDNIKSTIENNINFVAEFDNSSLKTKAIDESKIKEIKISYGTEKNRIGEEGTDTIINTEQAIEKYLNTKPNLESVAFLYREIDNIFNYIKTDGKSENEAKANEGIKNKIKKILESKPYVTSLILSRKTALLFDKLRDGLGLNIATGINQLDNYKETMTQALFSLENNIREFEETVGAVDKFLNTKWRDEMASIFSAVKNWVLEVSKTENIKTILLFLGGGAIVISSLITTLLNIIGLVQSKTKDLKNDNKNDSINKIVNPVNNNIEIAKN